MVRPSVGYARSPLVWFSVFFCILGLHREDLHSFPTRRSSDLYYDSLVYHMAMPAAYVQSHHWIRFPFLLYSALDRKSTRLNSSHANISYADFCLKKKAETLGDHFRNR